MVPRVSIAEKEEIIFLFERNVHKYYYDYASILSLLCSRNFVISAK